MFSLKPLTLKDLEEWLDGGFKGDPANPRSLCERTMSPNYLHFQAGGGRTNFEKAVENVTPFRTICKKWVAPVHFLVQKEGRKIAARLSCKLLVGVTPEMKMELMYIAERDDQGKFTNFWEQLAPIVKDEQVYVKRFSSVYKL
jgi:hypothetical protein